MLMADKTFLTSHKEWDPENAIADAVRGLLRGLNLDTTNYQFVVRIQIDQVDETPVEEDN